jgi:hypothetical protein
MPTNKITYNIVCPACGNPFPAWTGCISNFGEDAVYACDNCCVQEEEEVAYEYIWQRKTNVLFINASSVFSAAVLRRDRPKKDWLTRHTPIPQKSARQKQRDRLHALLKSPA